MISYAIKADLMKSLPMLLEGMELTEESIDLERIDTALSNCLSCCYRDLTVCMELDERLRSKHALGTLLRKLPLFESPLGVGGPYTAPPCSTRERLLQDKLGIRCKLIMECGLAGQPSDCVDMFV